MESKDANSKLRLLLRKEIKPGTLAGPFDYLSHHRYMETYLPFDQGPVLVFLPFQIDNLDSDTNQLSSILGATRSNLDKLNNTLVNTTLEVGLGMTEIVEIYLWWPDQLIRAVVTFVNHAFDKKF